MFLLCSFYSHILCSWIHRSMTTPIYPYSLTKGCQLIAKHIGTSSCCPEKIGLHKEGQKQSSRFSSKFSLVFFSFFIAELMFPNKNLFGRWFSRELLLLIHIVGMQAWGKRVREEDIRCMMINCVTMWMWWKFVFVMLFVCCSNCSNCMFYLNYLHSLPPPPSPLFSLNPVWLRPPSIYFSIQRCIVEFSFFSEASFCFQHSCCLVARNWSLPANAHVCHHDELSVIFGTASADAESVTINLPQRLAVKIDRRPDYVNCVTTRPAPEGSPWNRRRTFASFNYTLLSSYTYSDTSCGQAAHH